MKDLIGEFEAAGKPSEGDLHGNDTLSEEEQYYDPGTTYRRPDERQDSDANRRSNLELNAPRSGGLRRWNIDRRCYEFFWDGVWQQVEAPSKQSLIDLGYVKNRS
jgi:hypothetical protein